MSSLQGFDLQSLLSTGTILADVSSWTQDSGASVQAAAYCAWIQSITGTSPTVERIGSESRARVVLTPQQLSAMRSWLDSQVSGIFAKGKVPAVELGVGSIIVPWALQYTVPVILAAVLLGWFGNHYLGRKR